MRLLLSTEVRREKVGEGASEWLAKFGAARGQGFEIRLLVWRGCEGVESFEQHRGRWGSLFGSFSPRGARSKDDQQPDGRVAHNQKPFKHPWCRYRDSRHPWPARKEDSQTNRPRSPTKDAYLVIRFISCAKSLKALIYSVLIVTNRPRFGCYSQLLKFFTWSLTRS